jgi:predicted nuclease of predicted toxin-antitoxin system
VRFLIDECLHTSLTQVANNAGHEAHHVNWRGWSGFKDHQLREVILREEFVFVTNNARDFRKLMGVTELHAGLIVILPSVTPAIQRELFQRALVEALKLPDMINKVVEIDTSRMHVYELPKAKIAALIPIDDVVMRQCRTGKTRSSEGL